MCRTIFLRVTLSTKEANAPHHTFLFACHLSHIALQYPWQFVPKCSSYLHFARCDLLKKWSTHDLWINMNTDEPVWIKCTQTGSSVSQGYLYLVLQMQGVACYLLCSHSMILTRWNTSHTCIMLTLSTGSSISSNIFLYFEISCIYKSHVSLMLTAAWRSQESRADGFLWSLPRGIKTVEGLVLLSRPAIWGAYFLSCHF